jgi:hypothetical protein
MGIGPQLRGQLANYLAGRSFPGQGLAGVISNSQYAPHVSVMHCCVLARVSYASPDRAFFFLLRSFYLRMHVLLDTQHIHVCVYVLDALQPAPSPTSHILDAARPDKVPPALLFCVSVCTSLPNQPDGRRSCW